MLDLEGLSGPGGRKWREDEKEFSQRKKRGHNLALPSRGIAPEGFGGNGRRRRPFGGFHIFPLPFHPGDHFFTTKQQNQNNLYIRTLIFRPWMEMAGAVSAAAGEDVVGRARVGWHSVSGGAEVVSN